MAYLGKINLAEWAPHHPFARPSIHFGPNYPLPSTAPSAASEEAEEETNPPASSAPAQKKTE